MIIAITIVLGVGIFVARNQQKTVSTGAWVCKENAWIEEGGKASSEKPTTPCVSEATPTGAENQMTGIANPASVHCETQKGVLTMAKNAKGDEYGICTFEEGRQCEEWALFREECPKGGVKLTGYDTEEQRYCAIAGGQVDMEKKTCSLPDNRVCDLTNYYNSDCPFVSEK